MSKVTNYYLDLLALIAHSREPCHIWDCGHSFPQLRWEYQYLSLSGQSRCGDRPLWVFFEQSPFCGHS